MSPRCAFALVLAAVLGTSRSSFAQEPDAGAAPPATDPAGPDQSGDVPSLPHPLKAVQPVDPSAAAAQQQQQQAQAPQLVPKFATGFATITGSIEAIPSARPRNQFDYSGQAAAGIAATGTPFEMWSYLAYVTLGLSADAVNGSGGSISPEQITVSFAPLAGLTFLAGYQRIPFSVAQAAVITNVLFPTRPQVTTLFQSGADAGFLATYEHPSGLVQAKLGIFDGLSLGLTLPGFTPRGGVLSAWVDVSPLGAMPPIEGDAQRGPFKIALGAGVLYRPATEYDPSGYEGLHVSDVRFSSAFRVSYRGLFGQAEYLQDVQTDAISGRPRIARGAYGEGSYYFAVKTVGFAPLVRVGWSVQDQDFFPLHEISLDSGFAFYPRGDISQPGALRFVLEYLSERQAESHETSYGVLASGLVRF